MCTFGVLDEQEASLLLVPLGASSRLQNVFGSTIFLKLEFFRMHHLDLTLYRVAAITVTVDTRLLTHLESLKKSSHPVTLAPSGPIHHLSVCLILSLAESFRLTHFIPNNPLQHMILETPL